MMTPSTPIQSDNWTFWRVVWGTLVFAAVGLSFWLVYRFIQVIFMLFVAIVIGTLLRPAVIWLQRRGVPQKAGIILVYLLLLVFLTGFVFLIYPLIAGQSATITAAIPNYYENLQEWLLENPNPLTESLSSVLPPTLALPVPVQQTGQEMLDSAEQLLGYVVTAAQGIFTTVTILLLAFYWMRDGPRTIQSLLQLAPSGKRESISELVTAMETKVGAYLAGQGILCLIIGLMALIAYWLIGLPYVLVLAVVAGVMEAVPFVGPLLGAIPAGLVALSIGSDKLLWVVLATIAIQQLESAFLVPRVMRRAVGVNPFVSLLAIFAFSSLFGIPGALLAIPLVAIIQLLLNRYLFHPRETEHAVMVGRDYASRLRYEAQELTQDLRQQTRLTKKGAEKTIKEADQMMDEIEALTLDLDRLLAQKGREGQT